MEPVDRLSRDPAERYFQDFQDFQDFQSFLGALAAPPG
jgi:hypothetical protein